MMKLKKLLDIFISKFCRNYASFLLLFLIAFTEHIIGFNSFNIIPNAFVCALFEVTILCMIYLIIPRKFEIIYSIMLILLYELSFLMALISFCIYNRVMVSEICMLILGTNMQEANEFFNNYLEQFDVRYIIKTTIIYIAATHVTFLLLKLLLRKYIKNIVSIVLFVFAILLFVAPFNASLYASSVPLQVKAVMNCFIDLMKYQKTANLVSKRIEERPSNIVLIIGESHNRNHSSLYGYEKNTNPNLKEKLMQGNLFLFSNVISAATTTIPSFKYMMSTFSHDSQEAWYKHQTLPQIAKDSGYKTYWYSNQSKLGFWNNVIVKYATLFDNAYFCQDLHKNKQQNTYDEELLDLLAKHKPDTENNLIVFHLMGSHPAFESRIPKEYQQFKCSDYINKDSISRPLLAGYDNTLLYNDFVVNNIIEYFQDKEAIILYLSDHGLDMCQSDAGYAGHAKSNYESMKNAVEIPFWMYISPSLKSKASSLVERIKSSVDKPFMTDDLVYVIMDLMDVAFKGNEKEVEKYNILSTGFTSTDRIVNGLNYDNKSK
jgi:arylsulfatase